MTEFLSTVYAIPVQGKNGHKNRRRGDTAKENSNK